MLFILNDLQRYSAPRISPNKSTPWRSVTGKMPLVTKTNFLIGGFCHEALRAMGLLLASELQEKKEPERRPFVQKRPPLAGSNEVARYARS
jgi:hypothetical protein